MKQTISYTMPHSFSRDKHRLGVERLHLSENRLYSAGRDGSIHCHQLQWHSSETASSKNTFPSEFRTLKVLLSDKKPTHAGRTCRRVESSLGLVQRRYCREGDKCVHFYVWCICSVISASNDCTIVHRSAVSEDFLYAHTDYVKCLASGNDSALASGSLDGKLILWDLVKKLPVVQVSCGRSIWSLALSNLHLVLLGSSDKVSFARILFTSPLCGLQMIRLLDSRTGKTESKLKGHDGTVRRLLMNQDDSTVCI